MKEAVYRQLETKYAGCASWAIWDPNDPVDTAIIRRNFDSLQPWIVMVALNLSTSLVDEWRNFHSTDHARKLMYAFNHSPYRGAYMTDLIKGEVDPNSASMETRIENGNINITTHIQAFRREMDDLGANHETLFILFGRCADRLFKERLGEIYPNQVYCPHYSMYGRGYSDVEWVTKRGVFLRNITVQHLVPSILRGSPLITQCNQN